MMKVRIKGANAQKCPKCKSNLAYSIRGYKCKRCGYYKAEEESNIEKNWMRADYTRNIFGLW